MAEEKKELKDTLNLPKTTLAMRANATVRELEIQKFWEENKIYEKNLAQRDKVNSFILHDGPPYLSSDKIHVGTALNKILKDVILKYNPTIIFVEHDETFIEKVATKIIYFQVFLSNMDISFFLPLRGWRWPYRRW